MSKLVEVSPEDLKHQGYPPVAIRVDAAAAGMSSRMFPAKHTILALSGPPGGPLVVVVWDCSNLGPDVEGAVRARLVPPWTSALEVKHRDGAVLLGEHRDGVTFFTGAGRARIAWFATLVSVRDAQFLVGCGVPGASPDDVPAAEVLSNPAIKKAVESLQFI